MNKLTYRVSRINWRIVVALASLTTFALAGSANDPTPW